MTIGEVARDALKSYMSNNGKNLSLTMSCKAIMETCKELKDAGFIDTDDYFDAIDEHEEIKLSLDKIKQELEDTDDTEGD